MDEKEKRYPSLNDIPPREYMYFPKGVLKTGAPGSFSRLELIHMATAIVVLSIALSFIASPLWRFDLDRLLATLPLTFLGILAAFIPHELAHKIQAQRYGLWAEFRMYPTGLILALIVGVFLGFVFAAPGAVMFRGNAEKHKMGIIASSGATANIIIASVTYLLTFLPVPQTVKIILLYISAINSLLATFNILPYGPLDGVAIYDWNRRIWAVMMLFSLLLLALNLSSILQQLIPL